MDTGADLNIIKINSLNDDVTVNTHNQHQLQGTSGQLVQTIGSTWLTLDIGSQNRQFEFHVVPSSFPTPQDGIVGKPFLQGTSQYAVINLGKNEITLSEKNEMVLLARSESIIPVTVENLQLETQQILIHAQDIDQNVSCGNVLNNVKNQQILVSAVNTSEKPISIQIPKLQNLSFEIIKEASIMNVIDVQENTSDLTDRIQKLKQSVRVEHMSTEERSTILNLCSEFADIFHLDGDKITCTNVVYHEIKTPGITQPIHQKPYRLPYTQKNEIAKQVEQMEQDGIIVPSDSPWNAPLLVVPKKVDKSGKKKYRVVVDFRKLNNVTIGDAFPMPNVTEILDQLGKAKYLLY